MRTRSSPLLVSVLAAAAALLFAWPAHVSAAPNALASPLPAALGPEHLGLVARQDAHEHHHDEDEHPPVPPSEHEHGHAHGAPLLELNETLILQWHKPTPPSYGTHDFEDPAVTSKHPGLMGLHALLMSLAFFVALPAGIALRSVNHAWHAASTAAFYVLCILGISCSALYSKLTPNLYEGAKHSTHGYLVLAAASALTTVDALAAISRAFHFFVSVRRGEQPFSIGTFWSGVVLNKQSDAAEAEGEKRYEHEYTGLVVAEPEELDMDVQELKAAAHADAAHDGSLTHSPIETSHTERWANDVRAMHEEHRHRHASEWRHSIASDGTLFSPRRPSPRGSHHSDDILHDPTRQSEAAAKAPLLQRIGRGAFATVERTLVFLGYMQVLTGIVTYTGMCQDSYVNGCLAHLIKGGIFWCYGLVTFARFLGFYSELGWAWNRSPRPDSAVSAEFVESLVIFIYGITNTWMERFGIPAGTPFSTKEVQHISIAVMFWFAGLVGMGIESKRIRRWLSTSALSATSSAETSPPHSYLSSFNPFPALVIGVTGAAMAAHAQVYLFQVQIHALWGNLLCAFAVLRCLTYFFLWLGPPTSVLPSRPPTEALASFFLACGGLMFQFSTEELTLAAMRRGHGDQMMFLNVAVAFTCFAFCWALGIVTFKGWLKTRQLLALRNATTA